MKLVGDLSLSILALLSDSIFQLGKQLYRSFHHLTTKNTQPDNEPLTNLKLTKHSYSCKSSSINIFFQLTKQFFELVYTYFKILFNLTFDPTCQICLYFKDNFQLQKLSIFAILSLTYCQAQAKPTLNLPILSFVANL